MITRISSDHGIRERILGYWNIRKKLIPDTLITRHPFPDILIKLIYFLPIIGGTVLY